VHVGHDVGEPDRAGPGQRPPGHLPDRSRIGRLEVAHRRDPVVGQQPLAVERPEVPGRVVLAHALTDQDVAHHVRDSQPRGAGTQDDHALVGHSGAGRLHRRERRGEHHDRGPLHVVVERAVAVGVAVQDAPGIAGAEVLPVQQGVGEQLRCGADVGVDELVVALVAHAGVPQAQVHLVVKQRQVVRADVQHDRDHPPRVDARGRDVDRQLPDRDLDAAHTLVTDAQDALGVGGHDEVHVLGAKPVVDQGLLDVLRPVDREEHAPGTAVLVAEPLDRLPDGGGVDDRQHFVDVVGQQPVEQDLVAVAQVGQVDVLGQGVGLALVLPVDAAQLALQGRDPGRQQPHQAKLLTLVHGERRAPVDHRGREHGIAAGPYAYDWAVG
jgi:hypothetical protein